MGVKITKAINSPYFMLIIGMTLRITKNYYALA